MKIIAVPCDTYSRVVGYYRPVQDWNKGKQQEYHDRHQQTQEQMRGAAR
jgi:anaerobic ribonucleoside-triphosphate reductase